MKVGSTRIQREVIREVASELGISEEKAQRIVNLIANAIKSEVGEFVGRRSFLAGLAGIGTALAVGSVSARTIVTDEYIDIDGVKLALKDYADVFTSPAFASAVVEKPEYDPDHVYAWKPPNNYKGWRLIAHGKAGVDDAKVIQKTVTEIGEGQIFIKKGTYKITQKISCPAGVLFEGEPGTTLDLTELNNTAFEFNVEGNIVHDKPTGFINVKFTGNLNNSNTKVAIFENLPRGVRIEHVVLENILAGFDVKGPCFDTVIRDIKAKYSTNIVAFYANDSGKPNASVVDHLEVSAGWAINLSGVGVNIADEIASIWIVNSWFEAVDTGIVDKGTNTKILNNHFSCREIGVEIYSSHCEISDNTFQMGNNTIGVKVLLDFSNVKLVSNRFKAWSGTTGVKAIYSEVQPYMQVVGNKFYVLSLDGKCIDAPNAMLCDIVANKFVMKYDPDNATNIVIDIGNYNVISDNLIYNCNKAVKCGNGCVVQGNRIYKAVTMYDVGVNTYCDQMLYTTLPDTSNARVAEIFKNRPIHYYDGTNYYIAVWDGSTWRKVQLS